MWQNVLSPENLSAQNFFPNFFRVFLRPDSDSAGARAPYNTFSVVGFEKFQFLKFLAISSKVEYQILTRNLVKVDLKFLKQLFLDSAHHGLSKYIYYAHIVSLLKYPIGYGSPHPPKISNPRNMVNSDPKFFPKIFLDSAH